MKSSFEPIAILGRGCVFPGALDPEAFWKLIAEGGNAISGVAPDRWRVPVERVLGEGPEKTLTDRGGYVTGFVPTELQHLDQLTQWLLYCARQALKEAGIERVPARSGAIAGVLGLPSESLAQYAENVWLEQPNPIAPENRFMAGLSTHILARTLQLDLGAFALDGACASSIYAIKLACDALQDRRADLMLAGAVNRSDDLYLHIGFSTLKAVSPTGQSRPFHTGADGLLPSEGAGFVVLKRLADAEAAGDRILAIIRGVGISNDGRTAGLLTPSEPGQEQAIRAAYEVSGLEPRDISLIECHATGTPIGDASEIRSTGRVFSGLRNVPIGSVKSNIGHPITAAGMAGLFKIIGAMQAQVRPATLHLDSATLNPVLAGSPFRVLRENEPWESDGPRRAALSAFGFGGNNAHLIVEEPGFRQSPAMESSARPKIAIVSVGQVTGNPCAQSISLELQALGFPPADLEQSLPQQLMAMEAAAEALAKTSPLPGARTGVYAGMGTDAEVARYGLRWRTGIPVCPELTPAAVTGRLANIVANRISSRFDFRGPSFAVMSEEISGMVALRLAARALQAGEIDAALAGAVDLSCEPVHETALPVPAGDAAVFFVLKRLGDALAAGDTVLSVLEEPNPSAPAAPDEVTPRFGHAHAASGLLQVARQVVLQNKATVRVRALGGAEASVAVAPYPAPPGIYVYGGAGRAEVLQALQQNKPNSAGPARAVIVAATETELRDKLNRAMELPAALDGIYYREAPVTGDLGFVFAGAAAAYRGMGSTFFDAFPELLDDVTARMPRVAASAQWIFSDNARPNAYETLWASSLLSQVHAKFTLDVLGLRPAAAIGLSSGETNAIAALGAWTDLDTFHQEFEAAGLFEEMAAAGWQTWRLAVPETELKEILAANPKLRLTAIHSPGEYIVAGHADSLPQARAQRVHYDLVVHCPEFAPWKEKWRRLHARQTTAPAGVRFYSHAAKKQYKLTKKSIADALTQQALDTLNFPAVIEQAWKDGVRIFVEHGPQGGCTASVRRILGDREHVAVSLDLMSADSLRQTANAVAQLIAAGASPELTKIFDRPEHRTQAMKPASPGKRLTFAAHAQPVHIEHAPQVPAEVAAAPSRPRAADLFRRHAEALTRAHHEFIGQAGAGTHADFLARSQRAYLAALPQAGAVARHEAPPAPVLVLAPAPPAKAVWLSREDLERIASGPVSELLGPEFAPIDRYRRVVRMPLPPLLLADRVMSIDAQPRSMGTGAIHTETDIAKDSWFVFRDRIPAGILVESGQADLLLISWLGVDFEMKGERVYRLLGCELTFHGGAPKVGDTLCHEIHIDRHAKQGPVRLFFFHSDTRVNGEVRLSVHNGQAGFFTDEELAGSNGVLWDPETTGPTPNAAAPKPKVAGVPAAYSAEKLRLAAMGGVWECFGKGFEFAGPHQRGPGFCAPEHLLFDKVTKLDLTGGPWKRGYLKAELPIAPDAWFFAPHFKDDPCMPGTLMIDGCLQAMSFYLQALGTTLYRDGWRFEVVQDTAYQLRCRGQVIPSSKLLEYELFIDEFVDGPQPVLWADVLCTVDGLKAFHCKRLGLKLIPGYPHDDDPSYMILPPDPTPVAIMNGIPQDYTALLHCAVGPPSLAMGAPFERFEHGLRLPRLPSPPYHLVTRVTSVSGEFGVEKPGTWFTSELDVDGSEWFFRDNGTPVMPFGVLIESVLQPCGWLGSYCGTALRSPVEVFFRNLDGTLTVHNPVPAAPGTLKTTSKMTKVSSSGGMTIQFFEVHTTLNGIPILDAVTSFGYFRAEHLVKQAGLPANEKEMAIHNAPSDFRLELRAHPPRLMPRGDMLMIDRITGLWDKRIRAEKTVTPTDWFFRAHFYQDPVQPGSLGLEAIFQTLEYYAIHHELDKGIPNPHFEYVEQSDFRYRGQVFPVAKLMESEVEIREVVRDAAGVTIRAEASLWADGLRIYKMDKLALRIASTV
jgi:acyl transferase domain-containing protein/3-hydroxymyristoyl/3-hydroxydecanoyl-(acyl carrier protein) dehydratase